MAGDRGPGGAPERRPDLLERSSRAQAARLVSGMGLGLHLSRWIVELHRGELRAEFPADGGVRAVAPLPATRRRPR